MIPTRIPIRFKRRLPLSSFRVAENTSCPIADPCAWNWVLRVLIAAHSSVNVNMYVNHCGMDDEINVGMILSTFPPAA